MRCIINLMLAALPALAANQPSFAPAQDCAACHSNIATPDGKRQIAPFDLWKNSMMAQSARDPFWKAQVRFETAQHPEATQLIETKCYRCHAPMNRSEEGVSCTVCHQIQPANLGKPESFTGGFVIDIFHQIFGPHKDPFSMPMLHHTGFNPVEGKHMLDSSLCGTCHTVLIGDLVEQGPYLEWLRSDFSAAGRSCQSCHVPTLRGADGKPQAQYIATHMGMGWFGPTKPRTPFGQHYFAGANVAVLDSLGIPSEKTRQNLRQATALTVDRVAADKAIVTVRNLTGHKLPTGFPSRRMWIHFTAYNNAGAKVFESGAAEPAAAQPHRNVISAAAETQVYEALLDSPSQLSARRYLKDNRILPQGFQLKDGDKIGSVGVTGDADFVAGSDAVAYVVPTTAVRFEAELLYQTLSTQHASQIGAATLPTKATVIQVQ